LLLTSALAVAAVLSTGSAQDRFSIQPIPKSAAEMRTRFTPAQIDLLEKLNRRDREHLLRADPPVPGIVVPSTWEEEIAYSPFPAEWAVVAEYPKFLVVDQPMQAFAAYESGKLVRWGPVSTGRKETPTPSGLFNLTWRSRKRTSTDNAAWILEWYFNFVNERGVSFHQFELPGYAASHACARMLQRDAQWLYAWGQQWVLSEDKRSVAVPGTPVLVMGEFGHGKPGPWTSLDALGKTIELPSVVR
jgi:lipoprotein-anchoring transpeptidase ErfK/SrfK